MSTSVVITRFAPSPTGRLHLGNLRTALFNALLARRDRGKLLLRIEDTDAERSREAYVDALQEDLRWLGLDWQLGPYQQSQRTELYEEYFQSLEADGRAYWCFCSERELQLSRRAQLAAGKAPRYAGTCAHLSSEEVAAKRERGLQPTLRFRVPAGRTVAFEDLVRGPQRFLTDEIGDFIIRRADGSAAFFFSNALDDALMDVTHVLRGEDHLTNTPRQLLLLEALRLREPSYGHISMIVGADGSPLSKRHGSRSVEELRNRGYLSEAVLNYLARLGHYLSDNALMSVDGLAQAFSLEALGRSPARYDEQQLLHWQAEAVAAQDDDALWRWMAPAVEGRVPAERREAFIEVVRPNVRFPEEAREWAERLFGELPGLDDDAREVLRSAGPAFFRHGREALEAAGDDVQGFMNQLKERTGCKGKALFMPLRMALTGVAHGPQLGPLLTLIGTAAADRRLAHAEQTARSE